MKLSELCEFIVDSEHKTAPTQETGHPMIRTPNLGRGVFLLDGVRRVSAETYETWTRRGKPEFGDLILAREAPVGNVAMVPHGIRPCLGQRTVLIRPKHAEVSAKYLTYLIVGDEIQSRFHGMSSGATVAHLNMKDIRNLELPPLPRLATQEKIASILSAYDDLIENNTRRIAILEEMAQAVYREWFVNFKFPGHEDTKFIESKLGKIPAGWNWRDLGELGFVGRGKSRHRPRNAPELYGGPYPLFQTGDIKAATTFLCRHSQSYSEAGLAQSKLWEPGTLCITIAANIADTAILSKTSCFPDSVVGFIPNPDVPSVYFVKLYLDSIKRHMENVSRGTTQDNLSLQKLLQFKVPTPIDSVLRSFHESVSPMFDEVLCLIKKNNVLRDTRDLLLPKLISGQLNVEDLDIDTGLAEEELLGEPCNA